MLLEKYYEVLKRKEKGLYFRPFSDRTPIDFEKYLEREGFVIIAEIKKASPLKDNFRKDFDPLKIVQAYLKGGAKAISVITEEIFFRGSLEYLAAIRLVADLPLLRKDFILDPIQIEEAKAFGADLVLLISNILAKEDLRELIKQAKKLGLSSLVEVHDEEDLEKALSAGATLIGINNRNLKTLQVDTTQSLTLFDLIPKRCQVIAESGYQKPEDLIPLLKKGFKGVLIGTSLVKAKDPEKKLKAFREVVDGFST
ncbi:indole-3-glycerol phosphate synthase TrpC [Thermodesulfobacterium sp. TA1]|nr:indole-3-glycerol phosphate synthase TrpC [Thermodesulfobacterium sp. TA1]